MGNVVFWRVYEDESRLGYFILEDWGSKSCVEKGLE